MARALEADYKLVGIGGLGESATVVTQGYISAGETTRCDAAGRAATSSAASTTAAGRTSACRCTSVWWGSISTSSAAPSA